MCRGVRPRGGLSVVLGCHCLIVLYAAAWYAAALYTAVLGPAVGWLLYTRIPNYSLTHKVWCRDILSLLYGTGYDSVGVHCTRGHPLLADLSNMVYTKHSAQPIERDSWTEALHGSWDTKLHAHRRVRDTPTGQPVVHGDAQSLGDPCNMVEWVHSAHTEEDRICQVGCPLYTGGSAIG